MVPTSQLHGFAPRRVLAVVVAALVAVALLPSAAVAGHNTNNENPCAEAPVANEFVDRDEALATHRGSIDCAFYWSITTGSLSNDGETLSYNPAQLVRRDQMATFIYNTLANAGYDLPSRGGNDEFDDIEDNPNAGNINALARADIVRGTDADSFSPAERIRRDQMASFIVQAAEWAVGDEHPVESDGDDQFDDVPAANPHKGNIEAGADADPVLFRGVEENQFNPGVRVRRDQMATFLINLFRYVYDPEQAITPTTVTLGAQTVPQGGDLTGTIQGADEATVSGCGFDDQDLNDTDRDANNEELAFTVQIPSDQQVGECTLRFTVIRPNGQTAVRDVTITVTEFAQQVTEAPELVSAQFVRHTEAEGTPLPGDEFQQTTVRYTFDEAVVAEVAAASFHLVTFDGTRYNGASATREEGDTKSVLVVFGSNPNTVPPGTEVGAEEFADVTTATVDLNAVEDSDNNPNPEGDAPIATITFGAGVTDAPDLQSIGNFRPGAAEGQNAPTTTLVDFTFDQNAFVADDAFQLVLNDNVTINCTAATATNGDFVGDGTQTITVECPIENNANQQIPEGDVARGIAETGAVTAAEEDGANPNPLQASDDPNGQTTAPDLVSVTLNDDNTATFTFDQDVRLVTAADPITGDQEPNPGLFCLYETEGTEECGTAVEQEDTADETVVVTFPSGTTDVAVGGNVREGAVTGTDRTPQQNSNDEEPVDEAASFAGGETVGPDLLRVDREVTRQTTNPTTGATTPSEITFTYTFDETIAAVNDADTFIIYDEEANRTVLTECTTPGGTTPNNLEDDTATVECVVTANGGTRTGETGDPANAGAGFTEAQEAVLGTVDEGAVTDRAGDINHEAASPVRTGTTA